MKCESCGENLDLDGYPWGVPFCYTCERECKMPVPYWDIALAVLFIFMVFAALVFLRGGK